MMFNILLAMFFFTILSALLGVCLSFFSIFLLVKKSKFAEKIDNLLPQTQCGQCGYPGCYPYAEAILKKKEDINKCVPGGRKIYLKIAKILKINIDQNFFQDKKNYSKLINHTVYIDELNCIGCAKCLDVCPIDAIVGSFGFLHTVLQKFCTGCDLCVSICPMNCIKSKKL
ncbi:RnfABCDGE type electron transport complex subunit B [Buchnera aphidicola]|uniref:RnfABCDGE type electron transport complex subunit B n=1 Tax=Buchnera aphidicola TaxID=9 RepID=UPI0031B6F29B